MTKPVNPLDTFFNIEQEPGVDTDYPAVAMTEADLAALQAPTSEPSKDAEDEQIDQKIDEVYTASMETFRNQMDHVEMMEPRYAARNAEVAASFLNIALQAAAARARVKTDRKRNSTFIPFNSNNPNRTVTASRDEIMRMLASQDAEIKDKS
jgi:hypothetical protein